VTNKTTGTLFAAALLIAAGAWYHANDALDRTRSQLVAGELQPIIDNAQGEPGAHQSAAGGTLYGKGLWHS